MTSLLLYAIYTNSFTFCEGGGLVSVKKVQRIIVYCCVLPCNCVLPFCREFFHALVSFTFQPPTEMISPAQQQWEKERTGAREGDTRGEQGAPSPIACLPRARSFSFSLTTSKRLLRRLEMIGQQMKSYYRVARNLVLIFAVFAVFSVIRKNKFPQIKMTANIFPAKIYSRVNI